MGAFGYFSPIQPHWPFITAMFEYGGSGYRRSVRFVIDTGSCKTFISPFTQDYLDINSKHFTRYHSDIITVHGLVRFDCLTGCVLHFTTGGANVFAVRNIDILFAGTKTKKKLKKVSGKMPNVLGRDVLEHLSLAYHRNPDYLFLTRRKQDFYNAISTEFPRP